MAYGTTENSPVTFMNFTEDTVKQKAESVGRVMPHTEVGPRHPPPTTHLGVPLGHLLLSIRDPNSSLQTLRTPSHEVFLGLAWGFLCGLRPEREELEQWPAAS